MSPLVVLTEEASAKVLVEAIAEIIVPERHVTVLKHEGRSDLEASMPRKITSWRSSTPTRFVVLRDNDGADCHTAKRRLLALIPSDKRNVVKIRLVMQELESWYLGSPQALVDAGIDPRLLNPKKEKFRTVETLTNAKQEFRRIVPSGGQIDTARRLAPHIARNNNQCRSYLAFLSCLTTDW